MADRIAIISDVHGNLTALEAVLADIADRGIERILNLGDVAGKGPRGSAAVDRCREVCEVTVRGNWDEFLPAIADDRGPDLVWWRDELRQDQRDWLVSLPLSHDLLVSGRRVRLFHASAQSPHVRVHVRHTDDEFDGMFLATEMTGAGPGPDVVLYGDIHAAYAQTREGRTLVNVGSVGNPLDEPTPSYGVLEGVIDGVDPAPFGISFVRVPYDVDAEVAVAHERGMPTADVWEVELRTARYRGRQ
ncbi:metallophosphoesterase family protein [Pseudactinotalea suaedae]|uniref:metallophosphoesterase family protein n=1 Tax=Pseudactinotalea suaedae TaxID=1524924 RepID=UPI001F4FC6C5|nr:metallophosphoesterase family protein [Pseudactinotalea suaedae]